MELTKRRPASLKILSFCVACAVALLLAWPLSAEMVFSRSSLIIHPMTTPESDNQVRSAEPKPVFQLTKPIRLPVEIRPHSSFQSPSVYLSRTLQNNDAYLIPLPDLKALEERKSRVEDTLYPIPSIKPKAPSKALAPLLATRRATQHRIEPANVYAPVDMIAIDAQGVILRIWPNIILANLSGPILLPNESFAVLYLAGNRSGQLGITPHDRIENELFIAPPISLQ